MRTDFNADFGKIDTEMEKKSQVAYGSYRGNGDIMTQQINTVLSQTIALPFTPKAVFVCQQATTKNGNIPSIGGGIGITVDGTPAVIDGFALLKIVSSGFTVGSARTSNGTYCYPNLNLLDAIYMYLAIR